MHEALNHVVNPVNLVEYQDGTTVSMTLIKQDHGTVTLFAFDEGESLSEHTAPFDALVHVLEGKTRITIAGEVYELCGGEMILMPAHKPHAVRALSRFKMMLVMIRGSVKECHHE